MELEEQEVREAGIVREVTEVPEMKPYPRKSRLEGSLMDSRKEHPEKAMHSISVMLSGSITWVMEALLEKA